MRTDARVRTEEAEDASERAAPSGREREDERDLPVSGEETPAGSASPSLFPIPSLSRNPSLFPRDFLCTRALETTQGGRSPTQERFPTLGPFPFPRAAAHKYGDRLRLVGVAPDV